MNTQRIEPGLLKIFRLYNTIMWLLVLMAVSNRLDEQGHLDPFTALLLIQTSLLVFYLAWPRLRRWFGRFYLPIALIAVSLAPSIDYALQAFSRLADGLTGEQAVGDPGALLLC
jgi:hypothetical protein